MLTPLMDLVFCTLFARHEDGGPLHILLVYVCYSYELDCPQNEMWMYGWGKGVFRCGFHECLNLRVWHVICMSI